VVTLTKLYPSSHPVFSGGCVAWSFVLCVEFYRSLFVPFFVFSYGHTSFYGFWIAVIALSANNNRNKTTWLHVSFILFFIRVISFITQLKIIAECTFKRNSNNTYISFFWNFIAQIKTLSRHFFVPVPSQNLKF